MTKIAPRTALPVWDKANETGSDGYGMLYKLSENRDREEYRMLNACLPRCRLTTP